MNTDKRVTILNELKTRPLIKQRTEEWFKLRENRLTASDLYDAVYHPITLIKKKIKNVSFNSYSIPALKWGCMFEEVAANIYSHLNSIKINEFGLLINNNINNFGASPDGITDDGIMIEIKCPYSREIKDKVIPDKYYYQMQGQMAVCELDICDYIECKFKAFNNIDEYIDNIKNLDDNENGLNDYKHGIIAELKDHSYIYSKPNQNYNDNIDEMAKINDVKYVYWYLEIINVQRVYFDKDKWNNKTAKKIADYWKLYQSELNKKPVNLFIEDND
jgi:putative phage-type endonuclease